MKNFKFNISLIKSIKTYKGDQSNIKDHLANITSHSIELEFDEAHNGLVALEKFQQQMENRRCFAADCLQKVYSLILMDIQMPVMGGLEAIIEILKLDI